MYAADHTRHPPAEDADLVLRDAGAADAPAVAAILAEALGAKYRPAFGRRADAAIAGAVRDETARGLPGFIVAEREGEPIGVIHLATQDHDRRSDDEGWSALVGRVGFPRAARGWVVLRSLRRAPLEADELHISELGVVSAARRGGVASALLAEARRRAALAGMARLTLWVTVDNAGAIALYEREGFTARQTRRFYLGRLLFRSPGLTLMTLSLPADDLTHHH